MRCKHEHVLLSEETVAMLDFEILRGEIISDFACLASPTGHYKAECLDCGYNRHFHINSTFGLPRWVDVAYNARNGAAVRETLIAEESEEK